MQSKSMVFACGKAMALGALYDAIEKLKWKLQSTNSESGILMTAVRETGIPLLVRVIPKQGDQVEITLELVSGVISDRDSPAEAAALLFKTLTMIIDNALNTK